MTRKVRGLPVSWVLIVCLMLAIPLDGNCDEKSKAKKTAKQSDVTAGNGRKSGQDKERPGWIIRQNTPINPYASSQYATVSGAFAEVQAGPFTILVDAEKENITFVSHNSKLYYQGPFAEWKKRYYPESITSGRKFLEETKKTKKMYGVTARQAFFCAKSGVEVGKLREVWWTNDIDVTGAGSEYVWICSGLPVHSGVPLSISRLLPGGGKDPVMSTIDIKKSIVALGSFKPPPGYKRVKSEFELRVGKTEGLDELLGGD